MELNDKKSKTISKLLSLTLRHNPSTLKITLDENGWTDTTLLLESLAKHGNAITMDQLEYLVETNDKKRFAFNEDKSKIRASQGHSIDIDLALPPSQPPDFLYHGTATDSVNSILEKGIEKRSRQHVHLSLDKETATKVGSRHGKPYILTIQSGKMFEKGYEFFISENGVWLTEFVPAEFISK